MIKLATGVTPTCWRPPYGDIDDRVRSIATGLNLTSILWTWDTNDWSYGETPGVTTKKIDTNYNNLINAAKAGKFNTQGTIVLTHELTNFTMSEAIKYHPLLAAEFTMVPVGVAFNKTNPYVEQNYTQPTFAQYTSGTTMTNGSTTTSSASSSATSAASSSAGSSGSSKSGAVAHVPGAVLFVTVLAAIGGALCTMA